MRSALRTPGGSPETGTRDGVQSNEIRATDITTHSATYRGQGPAPADGPRTTGSAQSSDYFHMTGSAQTSGSREVDINHLGRADGKLSGAVTVAVGHLAIFVPQDADRLNIYDTQTAEHHGVDITHVATGTNKFSGAVAVDRLAIFAPAHSDHLMIYDAQTDEVCGIDITHVATGTMKFSGVVAVDHLAIFAPGHSDCVMIYDVQTGEIRNKDISHVAAGTIKFSGAVAVGHLAIFVPQDADRLIVYDTHTAELHHIDITHAATGTNKFAGAVAVGHLVIFAPAHSDRLVVYDTHTCEVRDMDITHIARGDWKFNGAVAAGHFAIFSPGRSEQMLIYDTQTARAWCPDRSPSPKPRRHLWCGAVTMGQLVILARADSGSLMIWDSQGLAFAFEHIHRVPKEGCSVSGAVVVGHLAVFVPRDADHLVIYDAQAGNSGVVEMAPVAAGMEKLSGATALGDLAVPDHLVISDAQAGNSGVVGIAPVAAGTEKLSGATALGDLADHMPVGSDRFMMCADSPMELQAAFPVCAVAPALQSLPDTLTAVRMFKATERSAHFVEYVEKFAPSKGCVAADACVQHHAGTALSKEPQERKKQLITLYTGDALYLEMNACLNLDDPIQMRVYSGYIRELREAFRTDDPDSVVHFHRGLLRRGICVDDPAAYLKQFHKGEEFMWASFTSTSTSEGFGGDVCFEIQCSLEIDGTKAQFAPASVCHLSQYAGEDEVLFPPHVRFRVVNVNVDDGTVMLETVEFPSPWELISSRDWAGFAKWAALNAARVGTKGCAFSVVNAVTTALVLEQVAGDPGTDVQAMVGPLLVCLGCQADINEVDPETGATPMLIIAKAAAQATGAGVHMAEKLLGWCIGAGGNIFLQSGQGEAAVDVFPELLQLAQQVDRAGFVWEYNVDDGVDGKEGGWYPFAAEACPQISTLYDAWCCDQTLSAQEVQSEGDSGTNFHYALSFASMTQRNVSTGKVRKIRRMALRV